MNKTAQYSLTLLLFCGLSKVSAQETNQYSDVWFLALNHYQLNEKWSIGNELHWRSTDFLKSKEQFLLRPFVSFKQNQSVTYALGYTYILSYPYAENSIPEPKPEHNFWEQLTLSHKEKKWIFHHRFRLENRFQGNLVLNNDNEYDVDGYDYSHRFRYRFTLNHPLGERFFVHAFDELWIKTNQDFQYPDYDRNWVYLGLGYKIFPQGNIQMAYLHQNIKKSDALFEFHPTVQFTFQYDFK